MLVPDDVIPLLLKAMPSFAAAWDESENVDDGERLLYLVVDDFRVRDVHDRAVRHLDTQAKRAFPDDLANLVLDRDDVAERHHVVNAGKKTGDEVLPDRRQQQRGTEPDGGEEPRDRTDLDASGTARSLWRTSVQPSGENMVCSSTSLPWLLDARTIFIFFWGQTTRDSDVL